MGPCVDGEWPRKQQRTRRKGASEQRDPGTTRTICGHEAAQGAPKKPKVAHGMESGTEGSKGASGSNTIGVRAIDYVNMVQSPRRVAEVAIEETSKGSSRGERDVSHPDKIYR